MTRLVAIVLACLAFGCAESHVRRGDGGDFVPGAGVTMPCRSGEGGSGRDCGWRFDRIETCTPGERITVACSDACGLGSCTGDAMIRLCAGTTDCRGASALAQSDDACGTLCPSTDATCPPAGEYVILTAPYSTGGSYTCNVATRP